MSYQLYISFSKAIVSLLIIFIVALSLALLFCCAQYSSSKLYFSIASYISSDKMLINCFLASIFLLACSLVIYKTSFILYNIKVNLFTLGCLCYLPVVRQPFIFSIIFFNALVTVVLCTFNIWAISS